MNISVNAGRRALVAITLAVAALTTVAPLAAQSTDARWTPWIGCWTPQDSLVITISGRNSPNRVVCVTPAPTGAGVDIASIVNGRVLSSERVDANGARVAKTVDGCPGWESAEWSNDGNRVFIRSQVVCKGNVTRKESGLLAMSSMGEWLDVQGVDVMGNTAVRVARFRDAGIAVSAKPGVGDSAIFADKADMGFAMRTARLAVGGRISPDDVLDVSRHVDSPVTEAWLTETAQGFAMDARTLVRLADAGVPARIMDLMIALSYPKQFAISKSNAGEAEQQRRAAGNGRTYATGGSRGRAYNQFSCDAFDDLLVGYGRYGRMSFDDGCYGNSSLYSRYGYNSGYGAGYGGYGYGNYYYGQRPIVIVTNPGSGVPGAPALPRGRAVNGRGYTRDSSPSTGSGSSSSGGSSIQGSGSSGGSSSGGSSGGSTGGSTGRTAKPRGG